MLQKANTVSGADLLLEILRNYSVEYLFSSPGTEWAPLWEALAKQKGQGIDGPVYLGSRHEDIATGMALGYAKATSKLAVCAVPQLWEPCMPAWGSALPISNAFRCWCYQGNRSPWARAAIAGSAANGNVS